MFGNFLRVLSLFSMFLLTAGVAQVPGDPPQPPPNLQSTAQTPETSKCAKPAKHKHTWADDFLIHGTVFNDKGLAFPRVEVRIRRVSEKKVRWHDATNSRGDFAIRVPYDASYEVLARARGFRDQAKTVDAKAGLTDETLAFRLEPLGGKK